MERITTRVKDGDFEMVEVGTSDDYIKAADRLADYEDIGLTPPEIQELVDRDTAQSPEESPDAFGNTKLICPNCRNSVINYFNRSRPPQFCMVCGQHLRWEE